MTTRTRQRTDGTRAEADSRRERLLGRRVRSLGHRVRLLGRRVRRAAGRGGLLAPAALAGLLAAALLRRRRRFQRTTAALVDGLRSDAFDAAADVADAPGEAAVDAADAAGAPDASEGAAPSESPLTEADLADLPKPVARYLSTVLPGGVPSTRTVLLRQRGEFRLGDANAPWRPFEATQHVATDPPGFVWDATIDVVPHVPVRVVDAYRNGTGSLRAALLSAITVAAADPDPALDAGELLRFLAESVWYPSVLLPGGGVEWEAVDEHSARATISHRGTTASLAFHFDGRGLVERVSGERPRRTDDGSYEWTPWTGHWRDYRVGDGRRVPTAGEVEWHLPDGDLRYWRGRLESIDYE